MRIRVDKKIDGERLKQADVYLKGYSLHKNMLKLSLYEKQRGLTSEWNEETPDELPLSRARMFEIRHKIMSLPNCDEKLMLYYHYIKGETIERCAELLGVSRSSGFRMNKRGLRMMAEKMSGTENGGKVRETDKSNDEI